MSKYAAADDEGRKPYVRTRSEWGRITTSIVWASTLKEAKEKYGWTRQRFVSYSLRRALPEDMPSPRQSGEHA